MSAVRDRIGRSLVGLAAVALFSGCPRNQVSALRATPDNAVAIRKALGEGKSATAAPAEVAQPTGWGTIRGQFTLGGTPPARLPLSITKDQQICAPGGRQVLSEELVVDQSGGIKDVAIYLTTKIPLDDPAFIHPDYDATKTAQLVFDQKECIFLTHLFAARTTNAIVLKNSDPIGHNTNIDGKGSAKINVNMAANDSTGYVPGKESPEPFDVNCSVHPWMAAKMLIRDTPYFAVTQPDGTFEIKNVPAGIPLAFKVWQEKLKFITTVKRQSGGQSTDEKWPRSGYKVTLQPDEVHEMNIVIPVQ
ncbi:MAG TPA: hypothetical protein VMP01_03760 [Pirellulaceae bacterium]|nr:hypothetical protein [Pirellulaceae bacterium]